MTLALLYVSPWVVGTLAVIGAAILFALLVVVYLSRWAAERRARRWMARMNRAASRQVKSPT